MKPILVVSVSGGQSSMLMARILQIAYCLDFTLIFVFANTGQEDERTLEFVRRCGEEWGMNIIWLEAVIDPVKRNGTTHKIVDFQTANRDGKHFEQMIAKYGVPNRAYPHCNRELKLAPIYSYLRSINLKKGEFLMAIGIRADEPKRLRREAASLGIVYPLASWFPRDKIDVNDWWDEQPFRLGLKEHEGNCVWCWKKTLTKHLRLINEQPGVLDFPDRMEKTYGNVRPGDFRQVMFRENRSAQDLLKMAKELHGAHIPAFDPDDDAGCGESCDINDEITA